MNAETYALPEFATAHEVIDHIRHTSLYLMEESNAPWVVTSYIIPTQTGDEIYLECSITDCDIVYAIGPTMSGSLAQQNHSRYNEAARDLEYCLSFQPETEDIVF